MSEADPARYLQVKNAWLELEALAPEQRDARLSELEQSDPELAAALRRRLAHSQRPVTALQRVEAAEAPLRIARYTLIRELGRGGMGRVWLAERILDDARQLVALKQIASTRWDDEDLRRFQRERRILASLEHPNIAALVDGGRDESGAPYLATSYIDGQHLDHWCETRALGVRARVQLLRQIAAAVAYAHRKLVVHRDLKPANILVTAEGSPMLLDFGVARLLAEEAITRTGGAQMTLRYAAPEQVRGAEADSGVGVDIYALGVLLYELLTDTSPYGELDGVAALTRAILELEPEAPSRRCRRLGRASPDADLDAICLRALRKRPEDRYASADALVEDLDRWLAREPVDARRHERGYRLRAMLRRRWPLMLGVLTVLLTATVLLSWHFVRMDQQLAETARERDKARAVASYFQELFASASPSETRASELTARELLQRSVDRLAQGDTSALDDDARASMYHAAGRVMQQQGLAEESATMLGRAIDLWLTIDPVPEDDLADAYNELALVRFGQSNYEATLDVLKVAIARREAMGDDGYVIGVLLQLQSVAVRMLGRRQTANEILSRSVDILGRNLPDSRANYAMGLGNLGTYLIYEGKLEDGHRRLAESLEQIRMLKPERTRALLQLQRNYAMSLRELGRFEDAGREYQNNIDRIREFFGDDHLEYARSLHSHAQMLMVEGKLDAALARIAEAEAVELKAQGKDSPRMAAYRADRARILIERGEFGAARALLDEVLALRADAVVSERANVAAERAAHAYAGCRETPSAQWLERLDAAVGQMSADPPVPRKLIPIADTWRETCARQVAALAEPGSGI